MEHELAHFYKQWDDHRARLKKESPDVARGFGALYQPVMKDGALSKLDKELISVGIAVATRCVPCINLHVRGAIDYGATREQVLEAAGVGVMMAGGPGFTYLPQVTKVLDHLEQQAAV